jgi:hypothetical protein
MQSKAALFRSLDSEKQRQNTKTETITNHHKAHIPVFRHPRSHKRPRRCQLRTPTTDEHLKSLATQTKYCSSTLMRMELTVSGVFRLPGSLQLLNLAVDLVRVGDVGLASASTEARQTGRELGFLGVVAPVRGRRDAVALDRGSHRSCRNMCQKKKHGHARMAYVNKTYQPRASSAREQHCGRGQRRPSRGGHKSHTISGVARDTDGGSCQ